MTHKIKGPYYPVGEVDWRCTCGELASLIDPSRWGASDLRRSDFYCVKEVSK